MTDLVVFILPFFTGLIGIVVGQFFRKNKKPISCNINLNELIKSIDLYKQSTNKLHKKTLNRIIELECLKQSPNIDEHG